AVVQGLGRRGGAVGLRRQPALLGEEVLNVGSAGAEQRTERKQREEANERRQDGSHRKRIQRTCRGGPIETGYRKRLVKFCDRRHGVAGRSAPPSDSPMRL